MKNHVLKKIMAYLLVGAMIISTPMTASANEITDAYATGTGTDADTDNNSGSNTNTNSSTNTESTPIPDVVDKYDLNITGIMLDKEALDFDEISTDSESVTDTLQARVLFDDYDPSGEVMEWAAINNDLKKEIESKIHWYSDNNKVAKAVWAKSDPKKATIKVVGPGKATVSAWIEADGLAYSNNLDRPTPGDYIATAVITVSEKITAIDFVQKPAKFYEKRTYDLKNYTVLKTNGGKEISPTSAEAEKLVYSISEVSKGTTATLSEDGILYIKKVKKNEEDKAYVKFDIVAPKSGVTLPAAKGEIKFGKAVPATKVELNCSNKETLDLGGDVDGKDTKIVEATLKNKTDSQTVTVDTLIDTRESGTVITDVVTWTTKNSKIADVEAVEGKNDLTQKIVAKGVGKTTITATASSGKKATINVTVDATPTGVKIIDINGNEEGSTYTGKRTTLTAVLTAKKGTVEIPAGVTKFKWTPDNKKLAKVSGKAVGTVTPATLVKDASSDSKKVIIKVEASQGKKFTALTDTYELTIKQSNVSNIKIDKKEENTWKNIVSKDAKKATDKLNISSYNEYQAASTETSEQQYNESIGWTISGAAATIDDNGKLVPVKAGKATVSANYVTINDKGKAKLNKKTIAVTVVQNATAIAFVKDQNVKNVSPKGKDQTVTLKVKAIEPKKCTLNVADWKVNASIKDSQDKRTEGQDKSVKPKGTGTYITKCTNNSVTVKIPGNAQVGSVIKVGAYTDGGVVAYAYIYVTEKTTKLTAPATLTVDLGKKKPIGEVKIGKESDSLPADSVDETFGTKGTEGTTTAYTTEPLTYSVDKNSAKFIRVDKNGNVTGLQKTPGKKTATVTIKSASGKTAKVKVTVK